MFDAERVLGAMLKQGVRSGSRGRRRRGGLNTLITGGVGMGVLAVAVEAFDHYSKKNAQTATPLPPGAAPPPPPPPPPPADVAREDARHHDAMILIRAMIAAANADGVIDANERNAIVQQLRAGGVPAEDQGFVLQEMLQPPSLEDIAAQVSTPELAAQVYAVSVSAIDVDTEAEREYLARLAEALALPHEQVREIHVAAGI
ncbi:MAG: uncharacterized membrane protein YebE (DUF533 family) [Kiritimatiellia bacterium]|jgi:uncharacterized membrane protein YebE (DUF533 family)